MWMTFNHRKTNSTKLAHYRPKILKVIEFLTFSLDATSSLCSTLISGISLILELVGPNLVHIVQLSLSPIALITFVKWIYCFAFEDKGSCSVESFPYNRNTVDKI